MMTFDAFREGQVMRRASITDIRTHPDYPVGTNATIEAFIAQITPSDELYYHCAIQSRWDAGMGSEGFVLFRDGIVSDQLLFRMN